MVSKGALDGIKVLDLSRFIAGPMCAMILGDFGADVIKVETGRGDDSRHFVPLVNGKGLQQMAYNRNKRAYVNDSRSSSGRDRLFRLAMWADVIVENFRPGVIEAMGLSYESVSEHNPGVILTSISGFGQFGPYRDRALFDPIAQAMTGLMSLSATADGTPKLSGTFFGDHLAGIYAALGTVAALNERQRSGKGQHLDIAVFDSLLSVIGPGIANFVLTGTAQKSTGNRDPYSAPANLFESVDAKIYIHAGTDGLFERLCDVMGRTDLLKDDHWSKLPGRMANVDAVEDLVQQWVSQLTSEEVEAELVRAGIPCGIVADVRRVAEDPQVREREMFVQMPDAAGDPTAFLGNPVRLSRTPVQYAAPPPLLGEHVAQIDDLIDSIQSPNSKGEGASR